jgi:hypothetical protein
MHTPDISTIDVATMGRSRRILLRGEAAAVGVALFGAHAIERAQASHFPERTIRMIATEVTTRAAPDGYTIFLASTTHSINPALRKLPSVRQGQLQTPR